MTNSESIRSEQRASILAVARQLFARQGYQATTTRQINAAFRGSEGLLYYYFKRGKREILDAIIAAGADWPLPDAWRFSAPQTPQALEQQVLAGLACWWQTMMTPAVYETILILIRERPQLRDAQVEWCATRDHQLRASLATALQALGQPFTMPEAKAETWATLIVGLYQKVVLEQLLIAGRPWQTVDLYAALQPGVHELVCELGGAE
ncbi:TetR/AcrR family transcriptional regulator [Lacticaseibacillus absianus]|uniref:TetR/AcrR family transcriptional regulator n=1 Tax=Lacticaseibacillus absianus TaxID=2729623 RepID=UPI0015CB0CD7|nr:TetR/AcrR family transcriptional regulator [Lacticaseibacillus absianus]